MTKPRLIPILSAVLQIGFCISIFISNAAYSMESGSEDCAECHEDVSLEMSVHADHDCDACHSEIVELGIDHAEDYQVRGVEVSESCGTCHEDANDQFNESIHGQSLALPGSRKEAAYCSNCHGAHEILPSSDPESLVHPRNLAHTCGVCHAKPELVAQYDIPDLHPVELFSKSYHAKQILEGKEDLAATCNDCHGVHDIKISTDPTSSISHSNIAGTCGTCHESIYEEYRRSAHWQALARGERESPACVDCHGEHEILSLADPRSPVSRRSSAEITCARCHTNQRLIDKYGLTTGKVSSYQDSYHGLAVMQGDPDAATCYDCHSAHEILSVEDPGSSIHPNNLKHTCSLCHPGATENFAQAYTHQSVIMAERAIEYYVRIIYIVLISVVIGGMLIHNGILLWGQLGRKYRSEQQQDYIQRYSPLQVLIHYLLIGSFFILVVTGFALKFPEAIWVQLLTKMGLTEALRGLIHRVSAVALIIVSLGHGFELVFMPRGREMVKALLPRKKDLSDFVQVMKQRFKRNTGEPDYDRFDYAEKVEYWALVWGTAIMIVTGFILWFPTYFGENAPAWMIKVSETIHYYEAWLASLAILVWHMYFVLLEHDHYPMNLTWLRGRMSLDIYQKKHAADFKRIMEEVDSIREGTIPMKDACYQAREYARRSPGNLKKEDR